MPRGSRAAAGRTRCRRPASSGRGSSPDGRGRCPSASTASGCRRRPAAGLRRVGALALVGEVRLHRLVHHRAWFTVPSNVLARERHALARGAERRETRGVSVHGRSLGRQPCLRTSTMPLVGRRRAADVDQVALGIDLLHAQVHLRVPLGAVVARHLLALDDARGVGARVEMEPGLRCFVLPCVLGPPPKPVALHHALEAAALRRAGDLHISPTVKMSTVDRVPGL
jgi:hypothetical protein